MSNIDKIRYGDKDYDISGNNETYSAEEQVIGTWVDGKPLYRKVLQIKKPTFNAYVEHNISNIETVISLDGVVCLNEWDYKKLNTTYIEGDTIKGRFCISLYSFLKDKYMIAAGSYYTDYIDVATVTLIVEYTKTTD